MDDLRRERSAEVICGPVMQALVWACVPGDLVFTVRVIAFSLMMVKALFGGERKRPYESVPAELAPQAAE